MIGLVVPIIAATLIAQIKAEYDEFKKTNPNGCFVCRDTKK
ncbi:hypothetical protein LCGC14_2365510, partial [marine sediment metagenome]